MQQAAVEAVSRAAQKAGVDFSALLETAKRESGLDKNAKAGTSSAAGLFQFIESTWLDMVQRYGPKYGIAAGDMHNAGERKRLLDLRYDPSVAAGLAGELTRENSAALEKAIGRAPNASELYAAHVLGADGAARLISAPANADAAALLPKAAGANRTIFYAEGGAPRSAADVLARLRIGPGTSAPPVAHAQNTSPLSGLLELTLGETFGRDLWALALKAYRPNDPS
jgi:hypothetical protein